MNLRELLQTFVTARSGETFSLDELVEAYTETTFEQWEDLLTGELGLAPTGGGGLDFNLVQTRLALTRSEERPSKPSSKLETEPQTELHLDNFAVQRRRCPDCALTHWRPVDTPQLCPRCKNDIPEPEPRPTRRLRWNPNTHTFTREESA